MENLISVDGFDFRFIDGKVSTVEIARVFNKRHKNIMQKLRVEFPNLVSHFNGLKIKPVDFIDEKGEKREMYLLNRDEMVLIIMGFTGDKARLFKILFIKAFNLLEEHYNETKSIERDVLEHTLNMAPKGTTSKVNGLPRTELIRSYYRSKKGKNILELDKKIAKCRKMLGGMFDGEIMDELRELESLREKILLES